MYKPRDNAMQNDGLNGLATHFPGVRCTVVTSEVAEKNIQRISFVNGRSHSPTLRDACRCTILDRVRWAQGFELRSDADFLVSPFEVLAETILAASRLQKSRAAGSGIARSKGVSRGCCNDGGNRPVLRKKPTLAAVARGQGKDGEDGDDGRCDQHPILGLDAENREVSCQKLHLARPLSCATYPFCQRKYIICISRSGAP